MTPAVAELLERLQSGWSPKADEIDTAVPQRDPIDWGWFMPEPAWGWIVLVGKIGAVEQREPELVALPSITADLLWIDRHLGWALASDALYWLYDAEEGAKIDYLGG